MPVVTMVGLSFGQMLGGIVIVELVFAWPGIGSLMLNGVTSRDYPVVFKVSVPRWPRLTIFVNFIVHALGTWSSTLGSSGRRMASSGLPTTTRLDVVRSADGAAGAVRPSRRVVVPRIGLGSVIDHGRGCDCVGCWAVHHSIRYRRAGPHEPPSAANVVARGSHRTHVGHGPARTRCIQQACRRHA